ncbi:triphosphoribosyl-dephospho-CoA synthase [Oxalobacter sp. OttesenSCG-928-P03]|nr:triphosphoribosyl-dephospho-CoA synthase [Oxalobacter sp. OttesenSCG-928-P03]
MNTLRKNTVTSLADRLSRSAVECLLEEARLSPKPGLVDARGSGAHSDMTLALMDRSAYSLMPGFHALAMQSWRRHPDMALRQRIGSIGRHAERAMLEATGGVNTHRGAIWALGLLVSASSILDGEGDIHTVTRTAATLARLPDRAAPPVFSKGLHASRRYGVAGAREEAQAAFPHVTGHALPRLWKSRAEGATESEARLDALMAIMSSLPDTCVLSRSGLAGLNIMQKGAQAVLKAGGTACEAGQRALAQLEKEMLACNASPGGAADLLAAALFLDRTAVRVITTN